MTSFKRMFPSINALVTFEAAVRLKSFTSAARELGVSQAAVSQQIRMLEEDFGITLFQRSHRRVEPTAAGAVLGTTLNQCFETISDTVEVIRQPRKADTLTVGATVAFSHFWLLPRLTGFREEHQDIKIRVVSQDAPFDLRTGEIDVLIRFGIAPFADGTIVASRSDVVYPVCSSKFARGLPSEISVNDLMSLPLIGSDIPDPNWISWNEWFEISGVQLKAPPLSLRFNHYTDCITVALSDQGVALGWDLFLERLIAQGQLVRLTNGIITPEAAFHVVVPLHRRSSRPAQLFASWIKKELEQGARQRAAD